MRIDHRQDTEFLARRELVNKVHGPDIVRANGCLTAIPELCLDPVLGVLVAQLKA